MPCSCCGQSGHNIRTCASGPTPGGVNGSRNSFSHSTPKSQSHGGVSGYSSGGYSSGYASYIPLSFSSPSPPPVPVSRASDDLMMMAQINKIKNDIIKNTDTKFDRIQLLHRENELLIESIESKLNTKFLKMEEKLEMNGKILRSCNQGMLLNYDKLTTKMEDESKNNSENYQKIMNEVKNSKSVILGYIDNKFKDISDKIAKVERKTQENEKKTLKNTKDIQEIKELLTLIIENQEAKERREEEVKPKTKTKNLEEGVSEDEWDEDELMSPEEVMKLTQDMIKSLKGCRTKEDQLKVVAGLAMKYVKKK